MRKTGAQAVHPGYGFLSENFKFCQALDEHGVTFIGPSVDAMAKMGDKIESKIIAKEAGVHTIPGFNGVCADHDQAIKIGRTGVRPSADLFLCSPRNRLSRHDQSVRGWRWQRDAHCVVRPPTREGVLNAHYCRNDEDVRENFRIAAAESKASFGDDRLLIEKYIEEPRHVEIQILGDKHGNIVRRLLVLH